MWSKYLLAGMVASSAVAASEDCSSNSNVGHLRDIAGYFTTKPFTRCDYNGVMVECDRLAELKLEDKKNKAPMNDPNERLP